MNHSFNFNEKIDRRQSWSIKYNPDFSPNKNSDLLPLWVADMDFKSPPEVIKAMQERLNHGVFGYTSPEKPYFDALKNWMQTSFSWEILDDWVVPVPGVVYALSTAIRSLTNPGDSVIIQRPVYYPFEKVIKNNQRNLVNNPLYHNKDTGKYEINYKDFEEKIINNHVKAFILCNPQNPVGRVWKLEELQKLGAICLEHGVIIISDEIHQDFVFSGHRHQVFANISDELSNVTITCTAPSKTFNLAGLETSNIIIKNSKLRRGFIDEKNNQFVNDPNLMGLIACEAAYAYGRPWLDSLLHYLKDNVTLLNDFINNNLPKIKLIKPQGTYLAWLDFNALNLNPNEQQAIMINHAKLWLDPGTMFGPEGKGYERLNFACPKSTLLEACEGLKKGFSSFQ
ncbi:MAG: MalY/PatB family protein [Eubacteriaceae bacterium]